MTIWKSIVRPNMTQTIKRTMTTEAAALKTVLVAGGSYAGHEAVRILSEILPESYKIVLLERNSHFNHVYVFPRYSVVDGHTHKAFIPYTNVFGSSLAKESRHELIQGTLLNINPPSNTNNQGESGIATFVQNNEEKSLPFDYLIYALGSYRPGSIDLWKSTYSGNKIDGIENVKEIQKSVNAAKNIVIVGSGPLGIEFAADIADHYTGTEAKNVTLLSSSTKLLPKLKDEVHQQTYTWLTQHGVNVLLGERLAEQNQDANGDINVKTNKGKTIQADLVLDCTGLKANTAPLKPLLGDNWLDQTPAWTNDKLQLLNTSPDEPQNKIHSFDNIYIAGDAGHAFGAHKNGANAREQAGIASRNICRQIAIIQQQSTNPESASWAKRFLANNGQQPELYKPGPIKIKVSLGLKDAISQGDYGVAYRKGEGRPDMNVEKHWKNRGLSTSDMHL